MAIGHFLIALLPKEYYETDKLCFEFDEDDGINEYTASSTVFQLCNFFKNMKSIKNIFDEYSGDMKIQDLFLTIMSINHTSKSILTPYLTEGDFIEEILDNGCDYGVSIVDFRNTKNIRYCFLLNSINGCDNYVHFDLYDYLKIHYNDYASRGQTKDILMEIRKEHLNVFKMNVDFQLIPQEEVEELFPKLFD